MKRRKKAPRPRPYNFDKIQKYIDYIISIPNHNCCPTIATGDGPGVYCDVFVKDGIPVSACCSSCHTPVKLPKVSEELFLKCTLKQKGCYGDKYSRILFQRKVYEGYPNDKKWQVIPRGESLI